MTRALFLLLFQHQTPAEHYAGGSTSKIAGTTALAGKFFRFLMSDVPQWLQIGGVVIGVPVAMIVAWQLWKRRRAIWAWWLATPAGLKFALVSGVGVMAMVGGAAGLFGYNYMMHDNDFCQSCHIMDIPWNRFQTTAHKDLQCHACHRQPMYASTVELFYWVTQRTMQVPPHDKVPTAVCSECHMRQGTDSAKTLVTLTAGHALHLKSDSSALKNVQCVTCHGRDFHVFIPNNSTCEQSGCHVGVKVNLGAMSTKGFMHCTTCHDFKGTVPPGTTPAQAKLAITPKALDCSGCHAMTKKMLGFDLAADPHKGNCGSCHDAHKQKEPKEAFKTCANAGCHASADTLTAFHRGLGSHALDDCGACHQAHSWKVRGTDCKSCHQTINLDRPRARPAAPAPKPGAKAVSLLPISYDTRRGVVARRHILRFATFSRARGTPPRHSTSAFAPDVGSNAAPVPESPRAAGVADTTFRHSIHKNLDCLECHGTTSTHGGLKIAAPAGCLGCHHGAAQKAQCQTCHQTQTLPMYAMAVPFAISARRDPVTRTLSFAHARHASLECTKCHGADAKRSVTATCATCHANHHLVTADCAGCHVSTKVGHDRTVHDGCAKCHTDAVVNALPATRNICVTCHQDKRNHYPAGECATCHALDRNMLSAGRVSGSGK